VARLEARTPVAVVGARGDWLRLRCSNDWEAWVGAGSLVPLGVTRAASGAGAMQSPAVLVPIVGAVVAAIGGALPWIGGRGGASAWDIPLVSLFTHEPTDVALDAGPVLLVALLVALPLITRRALPTVVATALGLLVVVLGGAGLFLYLDLDPRPTFGVGLALTLVGGILMVLGPLSPGRGAR